MNAPVTQLPARPSREAFKPLKECRSIGEALQTQEFMDRLRQSVPRHLSAERMLRTCVLAINKTPKLAQAPMMELLGAMLTLATLGLEPNTPLGHAYLIPFEKSKKEGNQWIKVVTIQVVIGYKGFLMLARNSGNLVSIHADVVYEGDEFSFEYGSNMHLRHVPKGDNEGRNPVWAYAHAKLTDGEAFEVLPYERVLRVRDGSEGYKSALSVKGNNPKAFEKNPWVAHEHEMAAKTMIRRISKMLPMSIEFMNAAALDAMSEGGRANFAAVAEATGVVGEDVAAIAASNEETIDVPAQQVQEPAAAPVQNATAQAEPVEQSQPAQTQADADKAALQDIPKFLDRRVKQDEQPAEEPADEAADETEAQLDKAGDPNEPWVFKPLRGPEKPYPAFHGAYNALLTAIGSHTGEALNKVMTNNEPLLNRLEKVYPDQHAAAINEAVNRGWEG